MEKLIRGRNRVIAFFYRFLLKPIFFLQDPERVHESMVCRGARLGRSAFWRRITRIAFYYRNPILTQNIAGITFTNPVGLAAGYDKDGKLTNIIPEVGFGFMEIGSVTGSSCTGNAGTRLRRLPHSKSLLINYGLKNVGADVIAESLSDSHCAIPLGISIAKTNTAVTIDEERGIADYVHAYVAFASKGVGDYLTVNISCPNACGGQPFLEAAPLDRLLAALAAARSRYADNSPWFLKLSADLYPPQVDDIINIARRYKVTGFICTNLTKNRRNKKIVEANVPAYGGLSGVVVRDLSTSMVRHIYHLTGKEFVIIGCGGIFSAEDAYEKIRAGATLLQLITGMIFNGPQLISEINQGLVMLLQRDGYTSLNEAVGADHNE